DLARTPSPGSARRAATLVYLSGSRTGNSRFAAWSPTAAADIIRRIRAAQGPDARGQVGLGRGRGAAPARGREEGRPSEPPGGWRPRWSRSDTLWRLGKGRHRLRLLTTGANGRATPPALADPEIRDGGHGPRPA